MPIIVEIIKALAWPIAAIWLGYIFRTEIRKLVSRISKVKYGDVEASFSQSLNKAEKSAQIIPSLKDASEKIEEVSPFSPKEILFRIAEVSPKAAVVEAWSLIEIAAINNGLWSENQTKKDNPKLVLVDLKRSGKLCPESLELIYQLSKIRNEAVHLPDLAISQSEAVRYLDLAIKSVAVIESKPTQSHSALSDK